MSVDAQETSKPKKVKYVVYYRVSTKKQGDSGLGLEAQKRDIGIFLGMYSDIPYEVLAEYTDVDSGTNSDRAELKNAIAHAKRSKAILLASRLDRLSRKVSHIAKLVEDKNLQLTIASMPNADKFQLHIYAALAEQERDFISARTKAALAEAKAQGTKLGGLRPQTDKKNKVRLENAKRNAEKFRELLAPMVKDGRSLRSMASALNTAGNRTVKGCEFSPTTVSRIIKRLDL